MTGLGWIRRFLYYPESFLPPIDAVLPGGEEVAFTTDDGLTLRSWFLAAADPLASVVVFHGNGGTMADRAPIAAGLAARRMNVLLAEYRGYGGNPGEPTEEGLIHDGRAAVRYATGRPEVDPGGLVLFGESLGSGVAVGLAAESPPAAMVLRSPFTSFAEVIAMHVPMLPAASLLPDRFDSLARIGSISCPLLVIAGSRDSIVPPEQSRRLNDAAGGPARYVEYPGADHNDWEIAAGEEMLDEVVAFIGGHL